MSVARVTVGHAIRIRGALRDAREFAELAALGEQRGWDGVFTWEAVWGLDAWVTLGAAAMVTERVKLGTLLTPAARWRPWDLASAVAPSTGSAAAGWCSASGSAP